MKPDIELDARSPREMQDAFARWRGAAGRGLRMAVFGRGADFQLMLDATPGLEKELAGVIDESGAPGCMSIAEAVALKPDVIVAASMAHQEAMRRKLRAAGFEGAVLLPYKNDPEIGPLVIRAYDKAQDWPSPDTAPAPRNTRAPRRIRSVLLVAPPFAKANARHKKTMPLGLLYIAASIRERLPEIKLELYDAHISRDSWEQAKRRIDSLDFDLLLCGCWSAQASPAFLLCDHVRKTRDALVVLGGVHPSLSPEDSLRHCDIAVSGEGERQIPALIEHVNATGSLEGFKPDNAFIEDLDALPFPAWDILRDPKDYDHPMHVVGGWRFPIVGSRGCPFNCSFCSSPLIWKRRVRWRSPANVAGEMDAARARFGVELFHFWDDNFLMNANYAQGLCEELLKRGSPYKWCGLSRASDIVRNARLLPLLKEAGCVGIEIGVESFSDQVSKAVDKGEFAGETALAAKALADAGIAPLYTHMLFVPGETLSSYPEKEAFIKGISAGITSSLKSDSELGQLTTPHIRTRFAEEAPSLGEVLWQGPDDSFHHRVNFLPASLLDETPSLKPGASMPDPLPWLASASQAIIDWTEEDMRAFVRTATPLWKLIDGVRSVRSMAESLAKESSLEPGKAQSFACLHMVAWARKGLVAGGKR